MFSVWVLCWIRRDTFEIKQLDFTSLLNDGLSNLSLAVLSAFEALLLHIYTVINPRG